MEGGQQGTQGNAQLARWLIPKGTSGPGSPHSVCCIAAVWHFYQWPARKHHIGPDHVCSWHKDWGNGTEGKGKGISMECTLLKAFGWHWRGRAAGMGDGADRLTDEMWRREWSVFQAEKLLFSLFFFFFNEKTETPRNCGANPFAFQFLCKPCNTCAPLTGSALLCSLAFSSFLTHFTGFQRFPALRCYCKSHKAPGWVFRLQMILKTWPEVTHLGLGTVGLVLLSKPGCGELQPQCSTSSLLHIPQPFLLEQLCPFLSPPNPSPPAAGWGFAAAFCHPSPAKSIQHSGLSVVSTYCFQSSFLSSCNPMPKNNGQASAEGI